MVHSIIFILVVCSFCFPAFYLRWFLCSWYLWRCIGRYWERLSFILSIHPRNHQHKAFFSHYVSSRVSMEFFCGVFQLPVFLGFLSGQFWPLLGVFLYSDLCILRVPQSRSWFRTNSSEWSRVDRIAAKDTTNRRYKPMCILNPFFWRRCLIGAACENKSFIFL